MAAPFVRLQAALARSGIDKPDGPFDDERIVTSCPICKTAQTLGQAEVHRDGPRTIYRCRNGCQELVIVFLLAEGAGRMPGEAAMTGYRFGGQFVVANARDILIPICGEWLRVPPEGFPPDLSDPSPIPGYG